MNPVKAIGFDLFNTLIAADPGGVDRAMTRIVDNLRQAGFSRKRKILKPSIARPPWVTSRKPAGKERKPITGSGSALP